ncbi:MAG: serine/threonine protein kinase [Candidatus Margulisbacteria bacterium]|jgi:serine/threonine-protein kinase|nr:serine/threonine protein kinase [Candidatus Margulisiibacteriota bacterium]
MEQLLKSKYRIGNKLAENPFSITYQGFFVGTEKPVIIKIYKRGTLNSSLIKNMKQKVLALSLLNHHGAAKLLDGDYGWQGFYYVREHVDGFSVQDLLNRGEKAGFEKAGAVADQALAALQAAHDKGIVHAGLKPANIFIDTQGLVKLTDFVIEGEIKAALPQKVEELMLGANYAAPEELQGRPVTPASDLYALGLILFELATGKPLVLPPGLAGGLTKLRNPQLLPKEDLNQLPGYLKEIILCATDREPLRRFASAAEFRESLEKRTLIKQPVADEELVRLFESVVTQYGGEGLDQESEVLQDVGRVRLRWGKEKHRNWILGVVAVLAVALGILYAFLLGL